MGFSFIASAAIIGVAVLISIEIIVGTTIPTITEVNDSYDQMKDRAIERLQTDITITGASWNNPNTEITIENTGSATFNTSKCTVLLNGAAKTFTCSVSYIHPEQTAIFYIAEQAVSQDILTIVTPNGVSDYYEY